MEPDNKTLKLRGVASKYMQLKKRNKEIREELKAQHIEVPERQANSDVERHMKNILDNKVADNSHIEGITPLLRTSSDQRIGFKHLQVLNIVNHYIHDSMELVTNLTTCKQVLTHICRGGSRIVILHYTVGHFFY
jgi:hypothetical protein